MGIIPARVTFYFPAFGPVFLGKNSGSYTVPFFKLVFTFFIIWTNVLRIINHLELVDQTNYLVGTAVRNCPIRCEKWTIE